MNVIPTHVKIMDNVRMESTLLNANADQDSKENVVKLVSKYKQRNQNNHN